MMMCDNPKLQSGLNLRNSKFRLIPEFTILSYLTMGLFENRRLPGYQQILMSLSLSKYMAFWGFLALFSDWGVRKSHGPSRHHGFQSQEQPVFAGLKRSKTVRGQVFFWGKYGNKCGQHMNNIEQFHEIEGTFGTRYRFPNPWLTNRIR